MLVYTPVTERSQAWVPGVPKLGLSLSSVSKLHLVIQVSKLHLVF